MKKSIIPFCNEIPDDWQEIPNKYLFEYHSVKVGNKWKDYQLLSLTTSGVKEKNINVSGGKAPESYDKYQTVEPGDMVFCLFDLDVSAVFSGLSHCHGMITSAYDVVRPNKNYLNQNYSDFWFQYVFSHRYYKMYSKNIRFTIGNDMFKSISTPIPPMKTQLIISAFLDKRTREIDSLIEIEKKQIDLLRQYKNMIITEQFEKYGRNYKKMRLRWLCEIISKGTTPSTIGRQTMLSGPVRFLRAENIQNNQIDLTNEMFIDNETNELLFRSQLQENDILFVIAGATIGKTAVFDYSHTPANTNQAVSFIRLKNKNKIFVDYVWLYLQSNNVKNKLDFLSVQSAQPNLSMWDLGNFYIKVYDENTTKCIVESIGEKCKKIEALISIKQAKIAALDEYKESLIFEYVTGKKEVNLCKILDKNGLD